ncbi:hypothetical protein B0H14DRAFT_2609393 [Mycena olivaceomarginata]|nr:hypothetical protein B0H14DRAFT_2609393 [Mycena olivaceomarginata]
MFKNTRKHLAVVDVAPMFVGRDIQPLFCKELATRPASISQILTSTQHKFTQLVALTMCTCYSTASPLSPPGLNTTLVSPNINIGTVTGSSISHGAIVAWALGKDCCKMGNLCSIQFGLADFDGVFDFDGKFDFNGYGSPLWVN